MLGVLGIVPAGRRRFPRLGDCRADRLAHLFGHEPTELLCALLEDISEARDEFSALGEGGMAVACEGLDRKVEAFIDLGVGQCVEALDQCAGRRDDTRDRHLESSALCFSLSLQSVSWFRPLQVEITLATDPRPDPFRESATV